MISRTACYSYVTLRLSGRNVQILMIPYKMALGLIRFKIMEVINFEYFRGPHQQ